MAAATDALRSFGQHLRTAMEAGLGAQEATAMLRWVAQGLPNHISRAKLQDLTAVRGFDRELRSIWDFLVGAPLTDGEWMQACTPLREGVCRPARRSPDAWPRTLLLGTRPPLPSPMCWAMRAARASLRGDAVERMTSLGRFLLYNAAAGSGTALSLVSLAAGERYRQQDLVGPTIERLITSASGELTARQRARAQEHLLCYRRPRSTACCQASTDWRSAAVV